MCTYVRMYVRTYVCSLRNWVWGLWISWSTQNCQVIGRVHFVRTCMYVCGIQNLKLLCRLLSTWNRCVCYNSSRHVRMCSLPLLVAINTLLIHHLPTNHQKDVYIHTYVYICVAFPWPWTFALPSCQCRARNTQLPPLEDPSEKRSLPPPRGSAVSNTR